MGIGLAEAEQARLSMERKCHELLYDMRVGLKGATHWDYEQREKDLRYAYECLGQALEVVEDYRQRWCEC